MGAVTIDKKELFGLNPNAPGLGRILGATKLLASVFETTSNIESAISFTFLVCFRPRVPFAFILG